MEADDHVSHLRNNLQCPICLELFTHPTSLPCGHSVCLDCIHKHWDREAATSSFTCPECRLPSPQRPEPQKNVILSNLVEDLKGLIRSRALVPTVQPGAHNVVPTLCQRHHLELTLYCSTENRCICCKCLLKGCRQHEVQEVDELSQLETKKLSDDLRDTDRQQRHTGEEIENWKRKIENIEDSHEKMVSGMIAKFEQVRKTLDECQILVVESVTCEKNAAVTRAAEHVMHLERHLQDLERHQMDAAMLLSNDGVAFLEGLPHLVPVGTAPGSPNVQLCGNLQMEAVTKILPEVTRLLQQELPTLLHPEKSIDKPKETSGIPSGIVVNDACCAAGISRLVVSEQKTSLRREPTRMSDLRAELCKDYRNLKFDPDTANKYIEISHENCKATHKSFRKNDVPNSPKRFQKWQVMCTEGFSEGSHYWEVGISTLFADLGVAYGSMTLDSTIGQNSSSWSLQLRSMRHSALHNNIVTKLSSPMFTEIGVHLDMTAGNLTFYGISDGSLQRLHSFPCLFSEKVFPVFWIGEDAHVTIHTIPNAATEE